MDNEQQKKLASEKMRNFFEKEEGIKRKGRAIKFPMKLMYVLDCEDYSHCISWTTPITKGKHNKVFFFQDSFTVHDVDAFASEVMPVLFKEAKYESFQRALYRWGFIKSHRKKKNRDSIDVKHSFTYHHTGNMFAKNDWEKCSILSYSKTLKSAKDLMNEMSNTRITFQPLDVDQKRVSLTYDTTFEKKAAAKQRGLERTSSPLDTLQTRRISNPNLLALDDIIFKKSNFNIPSTLSNLNLLTQSSSLYQPTTIPLNFPSFDDETKTQSYSGLSAVQNFANSEYAKSILERAHQALLNDTYFDHSNSCK